MTAEEKETLARVAPKLGLRLVVMYGSVARGKSTAMSDIDIGVLGAYPLSFEDEVTIGEAFAQAARLSKIEVKSLHQVSPLFLHKVMREGVVLYEDVAGRAQALRIYAWKLAVESKPLREASYARTREKIMSRV